MTTNIELIKHINDLKIPYFRGCFMRDELKNMKINKKECGIVNTNLSSENGIHWLCYYKNDDKQYYFDSYGSPMMTELKKYLKGNKTLCHNFQIQNFDESCCGEYCILFLFLMYKGCQYEDIVLELVDVLD
jgi:hypothetical protein